MRGDRESKRRTRDATVAVHRSPITSSGARDGNAAAARWRRLRVCQGLNASGLRISICRARAVFPVTSRNNFGRCSERREEYFSRYARVGFTSVSGKNTGKKKKNCFFKSTATTTRGGPYGFGRFTVTRNVCNSTGHIMLNP